MWFRRPKPLRESGFTLTEVMIALLVLIIVLVLSMSLLFSLRGFAMRQQMFAEPRQEGRQAVEYVAESLRQAGIIGRSTTGIEGIIVPYMNGAQTMWNNVQDATIGDLNTDVICITRPNASSSILIDKWPGFKHAANFQADYHAGCPDDALNRSLFLDEANAWNDPHLLMLIDGNGQIAVVQIDPWNGTNPGSHCQGAAPDWVGSYIHVVADVGSLYNPPGGHPELVDPVYISTTSFLTLRVKNGRLQQKFGWVIPATPDAGFVDLMENVVDLQFVFYMRNGAVFNNSAANRMPTANNIPLDPDATDVLSCSQVLGVGIHIITRSAAEAPVTMRKPLPFPLVADRTTLPPTVLTGTNVRRDRCFYHQAVTNAMIRNRILGF